MKIHSATPGSRLAIVGMFAAVALVTAACAADAPEDDTVEQSPAASSEELVEDIESDEVSALDEISAEEWRELVHGVGFDDSHVHCADMFPDRVVEHLKAFTGANITMVESGTIGGDLSGLSCTYSAYDDDEVPHALSLRFYWDDAITCDQLMDPASEGYREDENVHDEMTLSPEEGMDQREINACEGDTRIEVVLGAEEASLFYEFFVDDGYGRGLANELRDTLSDWNDLAYEEYQSRV